MLSKVGRIPHYANQSTRSLLSRALVRVYGLPSARLRALLWRPLLAANRARHLFLEENKPHIYVMRGQAREGGQPLSAAFLGFWQVGKDNNLPHFRHLLFEDDTVAVEDCGTFPIWQLRSECERQAQAADLVLVNTNSLLLWQPPAGEWVRGPSNLRMVFDFSDGQDWEAVERRMRKQQHNLSVMRRAGFTYRISQDEADFDLFYHQLYVPMVKTRYLDYGEVVSEEGIRSVFDRGGFLLLVMNPQGEVVSGGLQNIHHGVVYALVNGVRDGSRDLVRQGALTALYYFTLHWAYDNHCRRFDAGVCLPFETNGVFQHKTYWGFEPVFNAWRPDELLFWLPNGSSAADGWLEKNRFATQFARWKGPRMEKIYSSQ